MLVDAVICLTLSFGFWLDLCWFYSYTLHPEDAMFLGIWTAICFMRLEYSCVRSESGFVIYPSYGRLMKVKIPKVVTAACHLWSAVLKYQKLWTLTGFADSFSGDAWAVQIPGQGSLGPTNVNSHMFGYMGAAPEDPTGGGMENAVCAPYCLRKMQNFLHPKPHLVPQALDKGF